MNIWRRQYAAFFVGYSCLVILIYLFTVHGVKAITVHPSFVGMVMGAAKELGIPLGESIAKLLILVVGIIDLSVAIALLVYQKKAVFVYAGLWPVVPVVLAVMTSGHFAWKELIIAPLAAYGGYILIVQKSEKKGARGE